MNEQELLEFAYLLFGVGIVMLVYYPGLFHAIIPYIALLGAFYFVIGILSRITGGILGIHFSRKNDWLNGVVILTVVMLVFGHKELGVSAVYAIFGVIWNVLLGVISLLHV